MKEPGLFNRLVDSFRQWLSSLPDKRKGKNSRYGMEDAALSDFGVFFTQTPSFLAYQRKMADSKGKSNAPVEGLNNKLKMLKRQMYGKGTDIVVSSN